MFMQSKLNILIKLKMLSCQGIDILLKLRNRHILMLDILALLFIPTLALMIRLDQSVWWAQLRQALTFYTFISLAIKLSIFYYLGIYRRYWRYAGSSDLWRILQAVSLATLLLTVIVVASQTHLGQYDVIIPRTVPVIEGMLTGIFIGGLRFSIQGLYRFRLRPLKIGHGRRVLVVGAGEAGTIVVREMRTNPQLEMEPVAFVDDDPLKLGTQILDLPVLGTLEAIPTLVVQYRIQRIIVAIPAAPLIRQREVIARCEQMGITTHSLPGVYQILAGYKTINHLPKVDVNRLLQRPPILTDTAEMGNMLYGATVLVTGAGGSIGSELCCQIAKCEPAELILLGHGENSIFEIDLDLRLNYSGVATQAVIADVRDGLQLNRIVAKYRPQFIFHAAAHKHVHFMEANVVEAVTTNILGTRNVLQAAEQYQVEHVVLISTDKAVNPTSIMGATKRMAELLVIAAAQRSGQAYMAVRFGNVLGSRGSVIPVFQRQLAAGGPLTVTHPEMRRYFMTIPEAVQLVLQAAVLGQGGEVFVLDMGEQVPILDLATNMIKLAGLEPDRDIKVEFTGIRPGEKLSEELFLSGEEYQRTRHHKIFKARPESNLEAVALEGVVLELVKLSKQMENQTINEQIRVLLPKICYYIDKYRSQPRPSISTASDPSSSVLEPLRPHPSSASA
jgi:FlaA1/EpsC-like NDP-sugar epimerase